MATDDGVLVVTEDFDTIFEDIVHAMFRSQTFKSFYTIITGRFYLVTLFRSQDVDDFGRAGLDLP